MNSYHPAVLLAGLAVAVAAIRWAQADMTDQYFPPSVPGYGTEQGVTVLSRRHPEQEPLGVRLGDLGVVYPRLDIGIGYDDNPYLTGVGPKRAGGAVVTHPSIVAAAADDRLRLGLYADVTNTHYLSGSALDRTDYTMALGGSADLGDGKFSFALAHVRAHQDPGQIGAVVANAPVGFTVDNARLSYASPFGRLTITPDGDVSRLQFDQAQAGKQAISQSYRDRVVVRAGVTVAYEMAPRRDILLSVHGDATRYLNPQALQPSRDSNGASVLAGLDYDADGLWYFRALLGGATRHYSAYKTHSDLVGEATATWNPSGLTTVTARLSRSIEDAAQEGVAGFTYTGFGLVIDHEYRRDLLLQARAAVQFAKFQQGGGNQWQESIGLAITYALNRYMKVQLSYDHTNSSGSSTLAATGGARDQAYVTVKFGL